MQLHPLSLFKRLIEDTQYLNFLKNKFYCTYPTEMILELDKEREYIRIINPFDSESESMIRYFHHYVKETCYEGMHQCLEQVENDVLHAGDTAKERIFLKKIIEDIGLLISKRKQRDDLHKYPFIEAILESTKECLQVKYGLQGIKDAISPSKQKYKIQWMGKINILTTLFYDLLFEDKKKGISPIIKATPKEIENFILNNFVDEHGEPFSPSTINTNLKPSKQKDKRAKGDISIEIIRD